MSFFPRIAFLGLAWAALSMTGCGGGPPTLAPSEPPVVTVSQPIERPIVDFDQYTGRIEASDTVEIRARVRGELKETYFTDGTIVEKDKLLYEIDARPYKAALAAAEARKANAKANMTFANVEYERTASLLVSKAASPREVEGWLAKKGAAIADVALAEAELDKANLDLEFTKIKAPITGKISRSLVSKGNLVNTGGGDMLLTTIVSIDPIHVYFDVDERSLELFRERRAREVDAKKSDSPPVIPVFLGLVNDGDRFPREGKIDFADNIINPQTGTIRVRGVFPNKDGRLTPGQFARVRLPVGEKYNGLLVTDHAIGIDQGQRYVLVVNNQNKTEYRPVKPGRLDADLRIFGPDGGLNPGEWIIVNGVQRVRPGIEVKAEKVAMPVRPTAKERKDPGPDKKLAASSPS